MSARDGNFGALATGCIMLGSGDDRVQKPGQGSESRGVRTGFKGTVILLSGAPTSFVAPLTFLLHGEEEEDPAQILGQVGGPESIPPLWRQRLRPTRPEYLRRRERLHHGGPG